MLTNEISKVIDVRMKRVAQSPTPMLRGSLVATTQRFVPRISGTVLAGQAKIDQIVACGLPRPGEPLSSSLKVPPSVDLDGMKSFRIHPRRVKHYVICCTVTGKVLDKGFFKGYSMTYRCAILRSCMKWRPWSRIVRTAEAFNQVICRAHITDLCEESHELAERLEVGVVKRA
jgi:hypothetical protein